MNAVEETQFSSDLFSAIMKTPERLVEEFQIPARTKQRGEPVAERFQCPCRDCSFPFCRGRGMMGGLAAHIAQAHMQIPAALLDSTDTAEFVQKLKEKLDSIMLQIRNGGPRKIDSIKKSINAFEISFEQYKDEQRSRLHPVDSSHVAVELEGKDEDADSDADTACGGDGPGGGAAAAEAEEEARRDDWLLLQQGLRLVAAGLAARRADGATVDPGEPKVEDYLNKFELLRKGVTDLVGAAFDSHEGRDLFTAWSQHDYDELLEGEEPRHPAFTFRTEKEKGKRYYETDHIWEVQIVARAIREAQRFGPEYHLSLGQLIHVFETLNQVQNLNGTPWKLNLYKGKLMKDFKQYYQVTQATNFNTLESVIEGNHTYRRLFLAAVPLPGAAVTDSADSDGAAKTITGGRVLDHLKAAMRQVLVSHFYVSFFSETSDSALRMLYAVLCSMFEAMFPAELEAGAAAGPGRAVGRRLRNAGADGR